tara:strand:+ start:1475 stop:2419 length:945 start_codon:yes stop_codon:yes gene_type:complete
MAIKINGTNTIASPAITGDDVDTGVVYGDAAIDLSIGGASKAKLDASSLLVTAPLLDIFRDASSEASLKLRNSEGGCLVRTNDDTTFIDTDQIICRSEDETERLRIRDNGTLRVRQQNSTSTYNESTNWTSFMCNSSNGYDFKIINSNASPAYTYSLELAAVANVNNTNYRHISCTRNSESTSRFVVYGNGNVQNTNNSYGSLSDIKLKENIVDAKSQWNDVKALKVRNFNFKEDDTKTKLLGLVAQEAEAVCPSLVQNINDLNEDENGVKTEAGTVTKELKYSILYMKAFKCLQEAQTRIETLETKVAALEAA